VGNSRGARKLARTPHVNQKKKKKEIFINHKRLHVLLLLLLFCNLVGKGIKSSIQVFARKRNNNNIKKVFARKLC